MSRSVPPFHYSTPGADRPAPGRVSTSPIELEHIGIAYAVLTLDLWLILSGNSLLGQESGFGLGVNWSIVILAAAAALTGFLCHELAHKVAAQRRHSWAEFRMFPMGLVLSVFTAFLGFLFAAPGATVVGGMRDLKAWGETSLAGPLTNLGFGVAFFASAYGLGAAGVIGYSGFVFYALTILAFFNAWFAAFNMIPLGPLDGRKVLAWSAVTWTLTMIASAALAVFAYATNYLSHPLFIS